MEQEQPELRTKCQLKWQLDMLKDQLDLLKDQNGTRVGNKLKTDKIILSNYSKHKVYRPHLQMAVPVQGQVKYPTEDKIPQQASSIAEVKELIKLSCGVYYSFLHFIHVRERLYCYCRYQTCNWKILYHDQLQKRQYLITKGVHNYQVEKGKQVTIQKCYLIHNHQLTTNSSYIKRYYQNLQVNTRDRPIQQFISTIKNQIGVDLGIFGNKKLASKVKRVKKDQGLCNIIKSFYKRQIQYQMFPRLTNQQIIQKQLSEQFYMPDVIVFATSNFKKWYKKYGQFVRLIQFEDYKFFEAYVQQFSDQLRRLYMHLGVFIGTDCNDYHTIFGFALYYQMNSEVYFRMFEAFFQLMKQDIVTQTIITTFKGQLNQGLQKFRSCCSEFEFHHLYEFESVTKHFQVIQYKSRQVLLELMMEKDQYIFNKVVQSLFSDDQFMKDTVSQLKSKFSNESSKAVAASKLKQFAPKVFFTKIPNTFVGLYRHANIQFRGSKIQKIIRKAPKNNQCRWSSFIPQLADEIQSFITNKEVNMRFPDRALKQIFPAIQLRQCKKNVCKYVYQFLLEKYYESLEMDFVQDQDFTATKKITHKWKLQSNQEIKIYFKKLRWVCSCGQAFKTGIPCSHQIYGVVRASQKIIDYIHPRWIITPQLYKKCAQNRKKWSTKKTNDQ